MKSEIYVLSKGQQADKKKKTYVNTSLLKGYF